MNCKDLMVGDWVNYSILNINSKVVSIIGNHTITIQFVDKNNKVGVIHGLLEETINPIPLTEDILVKNGFEKTWNGDWQLKEYSTIIISKDYYVEIFERSIRIDYVHELQHMLHAACVDKELVID